ncbi:MAG: hypothetical protein ACE5HK_03070 [Candidatus Methylomirabilales bacterium]
MTLPDLKHNFHDSCLESSELGPRRTLRLRVALQPSAGATELRFGAMENFEAVRAYFPPLPTPPPDAHWDTVESLGHAEGSKSTARSLHIRLVLDRAGPLEIHCGKLAVR